MGPLLIAGAMVIAAILSPQTPTPEQAARARLAQDPGSWEPYVELATILREQGRPGDAADALRPATRDTAIKLPTIHWVSFVTYLVEQVQQTPNLSLFKKAELIAEADAATDLMIGLKWELPASMRAKSLVLEERAKWIERDPAKKQALRTRARQLWDEAQALSTGPAKPETAAEAWEHTRAEVYQKRLDGKRRESRQTLSSFLESHPDFGPALSCMGHELVLDADEIKDPGEPAATQRTRLLEAALPYFQSGLDRATDFETTMDALNGFDRALDTDHLNRPAKAELLWRAAMKQYPAEPGPYGRLLALLVKTNKLRDIDPVMRLADEQVKAAPEVRWQLGSLYWDLGARTKDLPRDAARKFLAAAGIIFDRVLAMKPDYLEGILYKGLTLKAQAERVEEDPVRVQALKEEAERLFARAKALREASRAAR